MIGAYKIDGIDMFTEYGVVVASGSDQFLSFPNSKEVFFHDFKDENGRQYWLSKRFFDDRICVLSVAIIAASEVDFWEKRDALWAKLSSPGERVLYIAELNHYFRCFYNGTKNTQRLTRIKIGGKIAVKMELEFKVIEPNSGGGVSTSFPYSLPFAFN